MDLRVFKYRCVQSEECRVKGMKNKSSHKIRVEQPTEQKCVCARVCVCDKL